MVPSESNAAATAPRVSDASRGRSVVVRLAGRCCQSCAVCDCRAPRTSADDVRQVMSGGGARILLRGAADTSAELESVLALAQDSGFRRVVVRTNAVAYDEARARRLAARGVHRVLVPLFSHRQDVHDRIAGRAGRMVETLVGMRALARAGVGIEVETPLLSPRIQDLPAMVSLAHRAVDRVAAVRLFLPQHRVPRAVSPPRWDVGAPALAAALARCGELNVPSPLTAEQAVPLCALRMHPEAWSAYRFHPRRGLGRGTDDYAAVCADCAVRAQCPGVAESYRAAHGDTDIVAYTERPKALYRQQRSPAPQKTVAQHRAGGRAKMLVLRPTVHCNQDCTFCSANETSSNVVPDPGDMLRQIARASRRGVEWVSFGGGEPTLSRDLPAQVGAARRLGIERIEVVTNGVLLCERRSVQALVDAGLTDAFVSLHAHTDEVSERITQKRGDFPRTMAAIEHFAALGVKTAVNHVICATNFRYLEDFVSLIADRCGTAVRISFAFITPQYKALENIHLVPRITEVWPTLRRAMYRALELGVPFTVGSRQGIPPCLLGEFRGWSDIFEHTDSAGGEDASQKVQAVACGECRYRNHCFGLWRPYVERFGDDELAPVRGPAFTSEEVDALLHHAQPPPFASPPGFHAVPELLRDRALERSVAPHAGVLPHQDGGMRLVMLGSGGRARHLAGAMAQVEGLALAAVASPNASSSRSPLGCPSYADAREAIAAVRPTGAVVASSTHAHAVLAEACIAAGVPVLVEKPFAATAEEAYRVADLAAQSGVPVMAAHQLLFAPGMTAIAQRPGVSAVRVRWSVPPRSSPRAWSASALHEHLYHLVYVMRHVCGPGEVCVLRASITGTSRPELVHVAVRLGSVTAEIAMDYGAAMENLSVVCLDGNSRELAAWCARGGDVEVREGGTVRTSRRGSEAERMLEAFRRLVEDGEAPVAGARDGADAVRITDQLMDALTPSFPDSAGPRRVATARRWLAGELPLPPLEWLAFQSGSKPALRQDAPHDAPRLVADLNRRGFAAVVAPYRGRSLLYVARTSDTAHALAAYEQRIEQAHATGPIAPLHREFGALLGYPTCCVEAFVERLARGVTEVGDGTTGHEDYVAARDAASRTERADWRLNIHAHPSARLVSFYPCSYSCAAAAEQARAVWHALAETRPLAAAALAEVLAESIAVHRNGDVMWPPRKGDAPVVLRFS